MSTARRNDHTLLMSPGCDVIWGPFKADSRRMQAMGWEFALERDSYGWRDKYRVLMRHRDSGLTGYGDLDAEVARGVSMQYMSFSIRHEDVRPTLHVRVMGHEHAVRLQYIAQHAPVFDRIDMSTRPESMTSEMVSKTIAELGVFRPWAPDAPELIVDPNSITDLMARITKLQDPELAEIRRRNRAREQFGKEQVVAQVLAFAA